MKMRALVAVPAVALLAILAFMVLASPRLGATATTRATTMASTTSNTSTTSNADGGALSSTSQSADSIGDLPGPPRYSVGDYVCFFDSAKHDEACGLVTDVQYHGQYLYVIKVAPNYAPVVPDSSTSGTATPTPAQ